MNMQKIIAGIISGTMLVVLLNGSTIYIKNGDIIKLPGQGGSLLYKSGSVTTTTTTTQPPSYWTPATNAMQAMIDFQASNSVAWLDVSGKDNHANIYGTNTAFIAGTNQYGRVEYAGSYVGTDNTYSRLTNIVGMTTNFTASIWFYKLTTSTEEMGVFTGASDSGQRWGIGQRSISVGGDGLFELLVYNSGWKRCSAADLPSTGTWHHAVGTYNGVNLKLYLDGILTNTVASGLPDYLSDNYTVIGCFRPPEVGTPTKAFNGYLDEVWIWTNYCADADMVTNLLAKTHPTNNLVAR